jgi:hypothetical protein
MEHELTADHWQDTSTRPGWMTHNQACAITEFRRDRNLMKKNSFKSLEMIVIAEREKLHRGCLSSLSEIGSEIRKDPFMLCEYTDRYNQVV